MRIDSAVQHHSTVHAVDVAYVGCDTLEDIDRLCAGLSEGGQLMPLSSYGFSTKFGWVNDRFGVSWQLNHP
ncbi:VOC family protein [Nonomuraea angiospora]|uniref:VOC family protein n=1 Tax=Nonomuraea angiospora TaxID=46172 RepID=UPI00333347DA